MASSDKTINRTPNSVENFITYSWGTVRVFIDFIFFLIIGLVSSYVFEWGGMLTIWSDEGVQHSADMLAIEASYLRADFTKEILGFTPSDISNMVLAETRDFLDSAEFWNRYFTVFNQPNFIGDNTVIEYWKAFVRWSSPYFESAYNVTLVFMVRLSIIFLSLPLIVLFVFLCLVDGLCQRELRKDGGDRESTTKFHFFAKHIALSLFLPFVLYLASPVATHPNWVLVPIVMVVGLLVYFASANYKKYV